ncbi:MAG: hypothetical protein V2I33_14370 [Kangiellaceae bacterium]|jgi:hypothetical protein|nr:hypothetical protein [Kangiellaceae bacterium]
MSKEDFDWDSAVGEWQSSSPDLPAIKKNMRWLALRMKLILAVDVLGLLILFPLAYFIFITHDEMSIKIWFGLACVLAIIGVYFDFYLRKDLWDFPETTSDVFKHLIKRAEAGVNLGRFSTFYLSAFLLCLLAWSGYFAIYEPDKFSTKITVLNVFVGFILIVFAIGVSMWYTKLKKRDVAIAYKDYVNYSNIENVE